MDVPVCRCSPPENNAGSISLVHSPGNRGGQFWLRYRRSFIIGQSVTHGFCMKLGYDREASCHFCLMFSVPSYSWLCTAKHSSIPNSIFIFFQVYYIAPCAGDGSFAGPKHRPKSPCGLSFNGWWCTVTT